MSSLSCCFWMCCFLGAIWWQVFFSKETALFASLWKQPFLQANFFLGCPDVGGLLRLLDLQRLPPLTSKRTSGKKAKILLKPMVLLGVLYCLKRKDVPKTSGFLAGYLLFEPKTPTASAPKAPYFLL